MSCVHQPVERALNLSDQYQIECNDHHVVVHFACSRPMLSSAILNGGLLRADRIVNVKVPKVLDVCERPDVSLQRYCDNLQWAGKTVGMMTAASMTSYRCYQDCVDGVEVSALVTCGLENARRIGDKADCRAMHCAPEHAGTINVMVITNAALMQAAMVESIMMITEAKAAVLQSIDYLSPVSGQVATGTGTDSIVLVSGDNGAPIQYAGKHVLFGELLGRVVMQALQDSMDWYIHR